MNKTEKGDWFRDEVAALLQAAGYKVETEILEGHKRADLVFEEISFGRRRKYVVEAKNWSKNLEKTHLEQIYGGYAGLINKRADELLIVSPLPIKSAAGKAFIQETPNISFVTFNEFQESLLGFQDYLASFIAKHERSGLEDYYISPLIENDIELEGLFNDWLQGPDKDPIAMIASYGMGKTSFSQHVAYKLAKRFFDGEPSRIPIIVSLGAFSREFILEGLIGSVLAGANPAVRGYKYPLFSHLNALGRFLIILDGFDEMKHMMTQADFLANFDELNKLVEGKSKVLLLGRPTAFLSDNEKVWVLRGMRPIGQKSVRTPNSPKYREINLRPFTLCQLQSFIHGYLSHHEINEELMVRRKNEIEHQDNQSLISRPIHARMIADLVTDADFDMKGLSRFALYDHFINNLILRELQKPGRGRLYKANDRRAFASDLSWFLWTRSLQTAGCRIDELPAELFRPFAPDGEDIDAVKRELISGAFLDEKKGGVFFFSHRSFQEFLVAEYIWNSINEDESCYLKYGQSIVDAITEEVFDFIIERDDGNFFVSFISYLNKCKQGVSISTFCAFCASQVMRDIASKKIAAHFSRWDAAILIGSIFVADFDTRRLLSVSKGISFKAEKKPSVILSSLKTVLGMGAFYDVDGDEIASSLIVLLFSRSDSDLRNLIRQNKRRKREDVLRDLIFETVSAAWSNNKEELIMSLDIAELYRLIEDATDIPIYFSDLSESAFSVYSSNFEEFFGQIAADRHSLIKEFFMRDADIHQTSKN